MPLCQPLASQQTGQHPPIIRRLGKLPAVGAASSLHQVPPVSCLTASKTWILIGHVVKLFNHRVDLVAAVVIENGQSVSSTVSQQYIH